jgi:DNA-binding NarL/FixJ family response regulator
MKNWERLITMLGLKRFPGKNHINLDENIHSVLDDIATLEQRPAREIQADLLAIGLAYRHSHKDQWLLWLSLTPREKEVAALICMDFTNRQIAARLQLSSDTVKGYSRQVLVKFKRHSKAELKLLLSDWDFSLLGKKVVDP